MTSNEPVKCANGVTTAVHLCAAQPCLLSVGHLAVQMLLARLAALEHGSHGFASGHLQFCSISGHDNAWRRRASPHAHGCEAFGCA